MMAGREIGRGERFDPPTQEETYLDLGQYGKHPHDGHWYARVPRNNQFDESLFCNLSNHDVTENADGTITVSPSILITSRRWVKERNEYEPVRWHGYLHEGVWYED